MLGGEVIVFQVHPFFVGLFKHQAEVFAEARLRGGGWVAGGVAGVVARWVGGIVARWTAGYVAGYTAACAARHPRQAIQSVAKLTAKRINIHLRIGSSQNRQHDPIGLAEQSQQQMIGRDFRISPPSSIRHSLLSGLNSLVSPTLRIKCHFRPFGVSDIASAKHLTHRYLYLFQVKQLDPDSSHQVF